MYREEQGQERRSETDHEDKSQEHDDILELNVISITSLLVWTWINILIQITPFYGVDILIIKTYHMLVRGRFEVDLSHAGSGRFDAALDRGHHVS